MLQLRVDECISWNMTTSHCTHSGKDLVPKKYYSPFIFTHGDKNSGAKEKSDSTVTRLDGYERFCILWGIFVGLYREFRGQRVLFSFGKARVKLLSNIKRPEGHLSQLWKLRPWIPSKVSLIIGPWMKDTLLAPKGILQKELKARSRWFTNEKQSR